MKYLEELTSGECFEFKDNFFILTQDFKKNGDRSCIQLDTGFSKWLKADSIVKITDIFTMDKDSNIVAIKERVKDNVSDQSKNLS